MHRIQSTLSVSRTTYPNGMVTEYEFGMTKPQLKCLGEVMKLAALEEASKSWQKNKIKKGGLNYSYGQESALRLAKKLLTA